jgi:hypothetical protein
MENGKEKRIMKERWKPKPKRKNGAHCCMPQCGTTAAKCGGLSFVSLPRKGITVEQDEWRTNLIRVINRADASFNPDKAKICSRHFEEKCLKYGK